jgi:hypothetical protein
MYDEPINPNTFIAAMNRRWCDTLGNQSSDSLRSVWKQIVTTFNRQIALHGTEEGRRWRVLQPATGSGKTQSLSVYCSMLDTERHPGVLIVTRLKAQADEIVSTINRLAGSEVAVAYHGDTKGALAAHSLAEWPVVAVTHRAYEIGLDNVNRIENRQAGNAISWDAYNAFRGGRRKLTVVDESLDIIQASQIDPDTVDAVLYALAKLPDEAKARYAPQLAAIKTMQNVFAEMKRTAAQRDESKPRVLAKGNLRMPAIYDMTELRRELPSLRLDRRFALRSDAKEQAFQVERISKALQDIQATLSSWNWYAHKVTGPSINTARLIVPDDIAGAVVLDATAGTSLAYRLFEDRVDVIPVPAKARSYENVTLHVSRGHRTGRGHWEQEASKEAPKFLAAVHERIGREHHVLVVCHLGAKAAFVGLAPEFQQYAVGTYGALDGRNDWANFDTVAICGLDHRDDVWADNTFMALQGVQSNEWLQSQRVVTEPRSPRVQGVPRHPGGPPRWGACDLDHPGHQPREVPQDHRRQRPLCPDQCFPPPALREEGRGHPQADPPGDAGNGR